MGRKKLTLQERCERMTKRRRFKFDDWTPFIELLSPYCQRWLIVGAIAKEFRSLLRIDDSVDIRTLTFLDFRLTRDEADDKPPCTHQQIYKCLAKLLDAIGCEGTKHGEAMIFRYICNGHSNLSVKEKPLQSAVNKLRTRIC